MDRSLRTSGIACPGLWTLALLSFVPAPVEAGSLAYQNMTNLVIMVQGSCTDAKGTVHKGPPHEINPKETAFDQVLMPGTKTITIYDPKQANRVYYQGTINFAGTDLLFSVQTDKAAAGAAPKVKLVPVALPVALPRKKK